MSEIEAVQLLEDSGAGSSSESYVTIYPRQLSSFTLKEILIALSIKYNIESVDGVIYATRRVNRYNI